MLKKKITTHDLVSHISFFTVIPPQSPSSTETTGSVADTLSILLKDTSAKQMLAVKGLKPRPSK